MSFIEIRNLTIDSSVDGIKFTAVNNLSLNIEEGQKVAILGESGAGKSLITKLMAGVMDTEKNVVSGGEIIVDGVNILEELKDTIHLDDYELGAWALEKTVDRFLALRQKCYIYEMDGKVHVTVAGATTGLGLNTFTGCAPISVGLIENTIVPVILAVSVSVIVETI